MAVHDIAVWAYWHGRLMVLAWVVLLPLGILLARFGKITPRQPWPAQLDNKFWWHGHLGLQYAGISAMTVAALLAGWNGDLRHSAMPWHGILGWAVVVLGWLQVLAGVLRGTKGGPQPDADAPLASAIRGDHYDMTPRRVWFERVHKSLGYLALALSALSVALGLRLAEAPAWMGRVIALVWIGGLAVFVVLQRRGRCVDTYEAIWGPDPRHPGHARRPIGPGIRRHDDGGPQFAQPTSTAEPRT